ncbi:MULTISPECIES: sensor domain-containing diguanylate cyclase [Psychrilyobacter]|uniref:Diguanylate cyclase n=1 Tax=Psychrilyobacter piezotolerans TaxID=2293438 RepID=A0ABX9KIR9_9FUSO|nr:MULTISPECIES: diguanylate cyclase [Psychrilyobacter]MCS5420617.1 diguanylate cyclase [Psychrilyobacter sp. S5]NDI77364.1 diguanylate cyclase [Psychrilyobacter piezotolerans]RDE63669.1 diguanylate cyclase [Psychrilyobacter sp. S5]REI42013.1 diguanylate cyclase [Psychrilyobacter piezotolerans]
MKITSIRQLLLHRLILMVLLPMFLVNWLVLSISVASIKKTIHRRNTMVKIMIDHFFQDYEDVLDQTHRVFSREDLEDHEKNDYLKTWIENFKGLEKLGILNLDGIIQYSSKAEDVGTDMSNFKFIESALNEEGAAWSGFAFYSRDGKKQIMAAKRFGENILVTHIDLQCFNKIFNEITENSRSKIFILDNDGNAIFYNAGDISTERQNSLRYKYIFRKKNRNHAEIDLIKEETSGDTVENFLEIKKTGWSIVFIEEEGRKFIFIWDFYKYIILILGLFTLIMISMVYFIIKKILSDIKKLKEIADRVSNEELPEKNNYKILEIEKLADKFLEMGKTVLERKNILKEEISFLETLLDTIPEPVYFKDKEQRYLGCNETYAGYLGIKKEELQGKTVYDLYPKDRADGYHKADEELIKTGKSQLYESKLINKILGCQRDVMFHKSVFRNLDGEIAGIIGVVQDITNLKKAMEKLKTLSTIDGLTEIYNRRGFDELSIKNWKEAIRCKKEVSVIMGDLDIFKLYNDHYGHQGGDECLKKIARVLKNSCKRPLDIVARYGGEEFIILLYNTNLEGAKVVSETIIKNIQNLNIEHVKSKHDKRVTISLGAASQIPIVGENIEILIKNADKMLYRAKENGGNRVEV